MRLIASASDGMGRRLLRHSPIRSRSSVGMRIRTGSMPDHIAHTDAVDKPARTAYTDIGYSGVMKP
jgi:hypothetical protein